MCAFGVQGKVFGKEACFFLFSYVVCFLGFILLAESLCGFVVEFFGGVHGQLVMVLAYLTSQAELFGFVDLFW